jgi:large subunit ribosomal protein L25
MIVDWQREPLNDQLIHIDLKRIAMDKALRVKVRVKLLGIPEGLKTGGILDQVLREVEIECLPADIPSRFDVDVSHLELHGVLRVSGLPHSEKIKYLNSEDATVAHVVTIREEAPTAAEVEAAAAAAAAAEVATAEPEVARKGGKPEDAGKKGKPEDAAKKPEAAAAAKKPEAKK